MDSICKSIYYKYIYNFLYCQFFVNNLSVFHVKHLTSDNFMELVDGEVLLCEGRNLLGCNLLKGVVPILVVGVW